MLRPTGRLLKTSLLTALTLAGCNTIPPRSTTPQQAQLTSTIPIELDQIKTPLEYWESTRPNHPQSGNSLAKPSSSQESLNTYIFTPLSFWERGQVLSALQDEMSLYPQRILEQFVDVAYCVKSLRVNGFEWAGTRMLNSPRDGGAIWLAPDYESKLTIFHGEFSSILYLTNQNHFPHEEWSSFNPPGFQYLGFDHFNPFSQSIELFVNPTLLEQGGWIREYATISEEQDFNDIVTELYTQPERLFSYAEHYPKLKGKINLTQNFLSQIYGDALTDNDFLARARPIGSDRR